VKRVILIRLLPLYLGHAVTIKNFSGVVKAGDLLLVGECSECHGHVARVIETSQQRKS